MQVVTVGQPHAQGRAESQGQGYRADGHAEGGALATADEAQVHLVADDEHEQDEPDVGQRGQRGDQAGREQRPGDGAVKERRSQQDPGEDLAQHGWLPEPPRGGAKQPGEDDDDSHVRQQQLDIVKAHPGPPQAASLNGDDVTYGSMS